MKSCPSLYFEKDWWKTQGLEKASLHLTKTRGVKGSNPGQIKQHIKVSLLSVNFAWSQGNDNLDVRLCYLLSWKKKKKNPITVCPVSHSKIKLWFRDLALKAAKGWGSYSPTLSWPFSVLFIIGFSQRTLRQLPGAHTSHPIKTSDLSKAFSALWKTPCAQHVWCGASVWAH